MPTEESPLVPAVADETYDALGAFLFSSMQLFQFPSLILYVLFLVVLVRDRTHFGTTRFFNIVVSIGIADMLVLFASTIDRFLVTTSGGNVVTWPAYIRIAYIKYLRICMWSGSRHAQYAGLAVLAVNRFTAIVTPLKHASIWTPRKALVIALCVNWAPTVLHVSTVTLTLDPIPQNTNIFGYEMAKQSIRIIYSYLLSTSLFCGMFSVSLYGVMTGSMLCTRLSGKVMAQTVKDKQKIELRLAVLGVFLTVVVLLQSMWSFLILTITGAVYVTPYWFGILYSIGLLYVKIVAYIDFIFIFMNPYCLLLMSSIARERFLLFIRCKSG